MIPLQSTKELLEWIKSNCMIQSTRGGLDYYCLSCETVENGLSELRKKDVLNKLEKRCNDEIYSLIVGEQSKNTEQSEQLRNAISAGLYRAITFIKELPEQGTPLGGIEK